MAEAQKTARQERSAAITVSSILFYIAGFGLPIGIPPITLFIIQNRELPVLFGVRLFCCGFIESLGLDAIIVSSLLLVAVSPLEIVAGYWLWKSLKKGGKLGIILLPIEMVFGIGFVDSMILVIGPLKAILIGVGWKTLR
ncbi:MAG: hypothetical protein ACE5KU_00415 [Nitrososphaerales archaeon]